MNKKLIEYATITLLSISFLSSKAMTETSIIVSQAITIDPKRQTEYMIDPDGHIRAVVPITHLMKHHRIQNNQNEKIPFDDPMIGYWENWIPAKLLTEKNGNEIRSYLHIGQYHNEPWGPPQVDHNKGYLTKHNGKCVALAYGYTEIVQCQTHQFVHIKIACMPNPTAPKKSFDDLLSEQLQHFDKNPSLTTQPLVDREESLEFAQEKKVITINQKSDDGQSLEHGPYGFFDKKETKKISKIGIMKYLENRERGHKRRNTFSTENDERKKPRLTR